MSNYKDEKIWKKFMKMKSNQLEDIISKRFTRHSIILRKLLGCTSPGNLVLEVGCGSAHDSSHLSLDNRHLVSLDLSKHAIDAAKKIRSHLNGKNQIVRGDVQNLPFKDQIFDLVFSSGLMHTFQDKGLGKAMNEQKRVLRKEGFLLIDVEYTFSVFQIIKLLLLLLGRFYWGRTKSYSRRGLKNLFENYGFKMVYVFS